MHEILNDAFYDFVRQYDPNGEDHFAGAVGYYLVRGEGAYMGLESHREALRTVFESLVRKSAEYIEQVRENLGDEAADRMEPWTFDISKAQAAALDPAGFVYCPEIIKKDHYGNAVYDAPWKPGSGDLGAPVPYWYAVMEPVHGERNKPVDFKKVNEALFPNGTDMLDIYEWTTDWSDIFDAGHEWYGACCWTVYDKTMDRYAVMLVSATD